MVNKIIVDTLVEGKTPIKDAVESKSLSDRAVARDKALHSNLSILKLPYTFTRGDTEVTIKKIRNTNHGVGVWYYAKRNDKFIASQSPHWTVNCPSFVKVSRSSIDVSGVRTVSQTLTEDIRQSWLDGLFRYLDTCPLGDPIGDDVTDVYASYTATLYNQDEDSTWATMIGTASSDGVDTTEAILECYTAASATNNQFAILNRGGYTFTTSTIGAGYAVSATILNIYNQGNYTGLGNPVIGVVAFSPASATGYVTSDYNNYTTTRWATDVNTPTESAYNSWTFNAAGIAGVNMTGYTTLYTLLSWEIDASFGGAWASGETTGFFPSSFTGGSDLPYLHITYAASAVHKITPCASYGSANMGWI